MYKYNNKFEILKFDLQHYSTKETTVITVNKNSMNTYMYTIQW